MEYININTKEIYSNIGEVRKALYPTSIPKVLTKEALEENGLDYLYNIQPLNIGIFQTAIKDGVITDESGKYIYNYKIQDSGFSEENKIQIAENTLKAEKEIQYKNFKLQLESKIKEITGDLSIVEISSWDKQEKEARSYILDSLIQTPYIDFLLVSRGLNETKEYLVNLIIAKADAYTGLHADTLGKYHKACKAVENITADITNIDIKLKEIQQVIF